MDSLQKKFVSLLLNSKKIVAITGAGISTSAGIPDFRGPNGLYSRKDIPAEQLFDIDYFRTDPSLFYSHINDLWEPFVSAKPTIAHCALASLEVKGILDVVITQNIDGLHHKAGSKNVISAHGNFEEFICMSCGKTTTDIESIRKVVVAKQIPRCSCNGVLKPQVVFFGEAVLGMDRAVASVSHADLLLVVGSSLVVHPVASLPRYKKQDTPLVIINKGDTPYDAYADIKIESDIDSVFLEIDK
jgi:NAD-dependent deacetylase